MDVTASVATCMSCGRAPVQIRTTAGERVGGYAQRDPAALVDYLTDLVPGATGSLSTQLLPLRRDRGGSALVVVTGMLEADSLPAVASLSRRFDHLIVASVVPRPTVTPTYPGVHVLVATSADELAQAWDAAVAR